MSVRIFSAPRHCGPQARARAYAVAVRARAGTVCARAVAVRAHAAGARARAVMVPAHAARARARTAAARVLAAASTAVLAFTLVLAPIPVPAQDHQLPDLGAAGGDALSPVAERRLGESIMGQARSLGLVYADAEFAEFLNTFGARIARTSAARGVATEFFPVREPSINAFALPGGFIGVNLGLIAVVESESELATVLGHEVGHVALRHIAQKLGQQRQTSLVAIASLLLGVLAAGAGGGGNAVMGAAALGETLAARQMMAFSRDAEREADRVGLDMLREARFDVRAAPKFFDRLQQANLFSEGAAYPAYLRSHPVSSERMTDLELRTRSMRPTLDLSDSLDFQLIRARAKAISSENVDALGAARRRFEQRLSGYERNDAALWFGLASVAAEQRAWPLARDALAQSEKRLGAPHPYLLRLGVQIALESGAIDEALARSQAALERYPFRLAIVRLRAAALLAARDYQAAVTLLSERTRSDLRSDGESWRMLAEAYQGLGQKGLAHRAAAEGYLLNEQRLPAIEQLRAAVRSGDMDFYTGSIVEAKMREQERLHREDLEAGGRRY